MVRGWVELCERVLLGCWLLEDAAGDIGQIGHCAEERSTQNSRKPTTCIFVDQIMSLCM